MKVAIIHAADYGGGAEACVLTLHRSLRASGHDSRLYVGYKHLDEEGVEAVPRIRPFKGALGLIKNIEELTGIQNLYAPGFRQLIRMLPLDVDIVHIHSVWGSSRYADIGAIALVSKRFPTILTLHDEWMLTGHCANSYQCVRWKLGCGHCPDLQRVPSISRDATRINVFRKRRALHQSAILITTVSEALKRQADQSPITSGLPIQVVYNGFDLNIFKPGSRKYSRDLLDLPQDKTLVLLTGKTIEDIKYDRAQQGARALELLNNPNVMPLLVGHSASDVATSLKIPSIIKPFQSTEEDMALIYQAADITVVASEAETFGRIAAESLACGTPVVTSDAGGLPEVVPNGLAGLVVNGGSVLGFLDALNVLVNDPSLRRRMGSDGHEWVRQKFSAEEINSQYLVLYEQIKSKYLSGLSSPDVHESSSL